MRGDFIGSSVIGIIETVASMNFKRCSSSSSNSLSCSSRESYYSATSSPGITTAITQPYTSVPFENVELKCFMKKQPQYGRVASTAENSG